MCLFASPSGNGSTHTNSLVGVSPRGEKHRQYATGSTPTLDPPPRGIVCLDPLPWGPHSAPPPRGRESHKRCGRGTTTVLRRREAGPCACHHHVPPSGNCLLRLHATQHPPPRHHMCRRGERRGHGGRKMERGGTLRV